MTASTPMPGNLLSPEPAAEAPVSFEEYETLARQMLDVAVSDINEMKAAMWRILASAPAGTKAPRLLRLAIAWLAERAAEQDSAPLPAVRPAGCRVVTNGGGRGHGIWRGCLNQPEPSRSHWSPGAPQSRQHDA